MNSPITTGIRSVSLCADARRAFQNLTLFPLRLLPDAEPSVPTYCTLDEAMAAQMVIITEVDADGSVPELRLQNRGTRSVLLLDGEELVGAKQNRTVNLTTLVAPGTQILLPVTCVEAGRWRAESAQFQSSPQAHFAEGRAAKQASVSEVLFQRRVPQADQGDVWARIRTKAARLHAPSPTSAMGEMFAVHTVTVEEYVAALTHGIAPNEVGGIFVLNGQVFGMERFDAPDTWRKLLPKIVRSFALDAVDKQDAANQVAIGDAGDAAAFLAQVAAAPVKTYPALGMGDNLRIRTAGLTGAALCVEDRIVHLSAFRLDEAVPVATNRARASERMRR